jgi:uncharacterized protein (TIGR03437 family)
MRRLWWALSIFCLAFSQVLQGQSPRIDLIDPPQSPIAGGTVVAIKGANLQGASLSVDKAVIVPASITASEIRFTSPPHDNGIASIKVSGVAGASYGELLYVPPKLSELPPGYITTIAGIALFSGFYRQATQAEITPTGSPAFDRSGNLYMPEPGFNRVSRVRPDGVLEPFAGNGVPFSSSGNVGDGGVASEAVVGSRGVAVDSDGTVYLTDYCRIRRVDAHTGIITTIAGDGTPGFSGDGAPALEAHLNGPTHITGDGQGTIFFIDFDGVSGTARIRKITPDGLISTVAGTGPPGFSGDGGPATQAQFNLIFADKGSLTRDPQGNLYIVDEGNGRIRKIDGGTGIITTFFGPLNSPPTGLTGVASDAKGNIYTGLGAPGWQILAISPNGQVLAKYGSGRFPGFSEDGTPIMDAYITNWLTGLAIDPSGNVVYVDQDLNRVRRLNLTSGKLETLAGMGPSIIGENGPATATVLENFNSDLGFLPTGELLIGDSGHNLLRKVDANGTISTFAKGGIAAEMDGPPPGQFFYGPFSVKPDGAGNIYLADSWAIYRLDKAGMVHLVAGRVGDCGFSGDGGPAADAQLCQPWDVTFDTAGNLFIADSNNNRVRRIDAQSGIITTVAGSGPVNGYEHYNQNGKGSVCGDGGQATKACLNTPYGVALDRNGNLYIADFSGRIRKVDGNGIITTFAVAPVSIYTKLVFDSAGYLYGVAGSALVRYDSNGAATVIAGNLSASGFSGDGGPALQAHMHAFLQSEGIAIDSEGNLFFNDGDNLRVRAVRYGAVLAPPGARIQASRGTPQSTAPSTAFATPLDALVLDSAGRPAPGVRVEFSAPAAGPSCAFSNGTPFAGIVTDRSGLASALCTANAQQGSYSVTATPITSTATVHFALTNIIPPPLVTGSSSVLNAASFIGGAVAPGEVVTIFGSNIGPAQGATLQLAAPGVVGTVLAGICVLFDGQPAPLIYVQGGQDNLVVPYSVAQKASTQLQVEYLGVKSNPISLSVAVAAPGIFSTNSSGKGQGAILNEDSTANSTSKPAGPNTIIQIFATGEGQTDPPGVDGKIASDVLPKPRLPVSVTIGGLDAEVVYYGAAPTLVAGVFQVNAKVPAGVAPGPAINVRLTVGGIASNEVTIVVQ